MPFEGVDLDTSYLPAERETSELIVLRSRLIARSGLPKMFDQDPVPNLILGSTRQIVYANEAALSLFAAGSPGEVLGKRPGEALGCVHASDSPGGCGTGENCRFCGAANSLASSLSGIQARAECSILRATRSDFESLDVLVWSAPINAGGLDFIRFTAHDISLRKRKEILERIFFHDIGNTVMGIKSLLGLISLEESGLEPERLELLNSAADYLVEEIASQRALHSAETGELSASFELRQGLSLLKESLALFRYYLYGRGVELRLDAVSSDFLLETDPTLIRRVLINLIKNALEASFSGGVVEAGCAAEGEAARFWVKNAQVMSEETKRRMFSRSYSTKGRGRGLGSYSARLLTESYLGGELGFTSIEGEGTVFTLRLPLRRSPPRLA